MTILKKGSKGSQVKKWQLFLIGQNLLNDIADGDFGTKTQNATIEFQKNNQIEQDGRVGNNTLGVAMLLGFDVVKDDDEGEQGPNWPSEPDFPPLVGTAERQRVFGKFSYKSIGNGEIEILGTWEEDNIIKVEIPQLVIVRNRITREEDKALIPKDGKIRFHKLAAEQLQSLWDTWEKKGLLDLVINYAGSFVPRFIRGSNTTLSNHAFGTAFDINAAWNGLGCVPALVGETGSVRELVPHANKLGFYWGGHFTSRKDGMHFEVAKVL
jgi:hypothetical protein